ncbi:MAG: outer membrane beta-barrel protein [Terriglobales bacterium]
MVKFPSSHWFRRMLLMAALGGVSLAQTAQAPQPTAAAPSAVAPAQCEISGKVSTGNVPLPGVTITASNSLTGKKSATSTGLDGRYTLSVGPKGRFVVRAEFAAFATATSEIVMNAENCHASVNLPMTLLSRVQTTPEDGDTESQGGQRQGFSVATQRGFQSLGLSADASAADVQGNPTSANGGQTWGTNGGNGTNGNSGMPPSSFVNEGSTESVAVAGNNAQSNDSMFGDDMRMRGDGPPGGGPGGPPGGPGGFRGGPGGGPGVFRLGGRRGRFNFNQPHGAVFYTLGNSAFDAKPFSLTGEPTEKPDYTQNRFGFMIGGPLNIPKIYHGGTKTFFFANYFGNLSQNPYDVFSTVPTAAERNGIFTGLTDRNGVAVTVVNPATGLPFAQNTIPANMISNSAKQLMNYIPLPNLPGTTQNFHYVTSTTNDSNNLNVRLIHNFGSGGFQPGMGRRGGGNNINFGFHWQTSNNDLTNPFPTLTGNTRSSAFDIPIGWVKSKGHFTNNARFDFNRSHLETTNAFANVLNVAAVVGITGVSQDPFDWGVPGVSFTNYAGLTDFTPRVQTDQTVTVGDNMILNHGKHNIRWGGEFRRLQINTRTDANARGSFIFTNLYSGYDFADFLLGLSEQASAQYGSTGYHFRGNVWNAYVQDDWRVRSNLTLNIGLRYEYYSPLTEVNNQLVNLDIAPGVTAVTPVCAAGSGASPSQCAIGVGPYSGAYPSSLVNPDRNNFAPRVGIAWKPFAKTVVRAGYGINYNTSAFNNIALQMAYQPPFAFTQTNVGAAATPIDITNAFTTTTTTGITNNYGVDKNYRMGYVQIWNLDIQREIRRDIVLNVNYTGTKGTRLDILTAPNRTATGLLLPDVQPFLFETSLGDSIMHSGSVSLRKRMSSGISLGARYVYSKSIDDASSIGGGATTVAQDALDLAAERGLSSFDRRHQFTGDFIFELPWGQNKKWLNTKSTAASIFGDWSLSGSFTVESGIPFTPRCVGCAQDVSRGSNGSLRADYTGLPVTVSNPTISEWFNTAAFVEPLPGTYGDAGRNSIIGPGAAVLNAALAKDFSFGETRNLEVRWQVNNVLNSAQYTVIDTNVKSPTFGQVTGVGAMRTMQLVARFRF